MKLIFFSNCKRRDMSWVNGFMAAALAFLLLCGCREKKAENKNDYLRSAEEAISDGRFDEAIRDLKKSISLDPNAAKAYMKLGLIYEKIEVDIEKAKESYRKYLEIEKDDALKGMVREWLGRLEGVESEVKKSSPENEGKLLRLVLERNRKEHEAELRKIRDEHEDEIERLNKELESARLAVDNSGEAKKGNGGKGGPSEVETLKKKIDALTSELEVVRRNDDAHLQELAASKADLKAKETEVARLNEQLARMKKEVNAALVRVTRLEKEVGRTGATAGREIKTRKDVPGVKGISGNTIYYEVQQSDTLSLIAEKFYGDKKLWREIFNANRDRLANENDIRIGQTLKVPILK